MKTIAEAVEMTEEPARVKQHGTAYVQGCYFARPAVPPLLHADSELLLVPKTKVEAS